jgi:hypothetical protein
MPPPDRLTTSGAGFSAMLEVQGEQITRRRLAREGDQRTEVPGGEIAGEQSLRAVVGYSLLG